MWTGDGKRAGRLVLAAAAAVLLNHAPAMAGDGGAPDAHEWDIAFGATVTSDYLSRGLSNTEHGAAIQPWAELDVGILYAGYWGSNVTASGTSYWESDLSVGIRPTLGPFSFDFGYVYYVYSSGDYASPSGEAYAKATINPVDPLTLGAAFYIDPQNTSATYSELNAAYDGPHNISVSGALGFVTGNDTYNDYTTWNAGISWKPVEQVTLDARYHAGPDADKFLFSVSFELSIKSLGIFH